MPKTQAKPPVILWYRVYSAAMALLYTALTVLVGIGFFLKPEHIDATDMPPWFFFIYISVIIFISVVLSTVFIVSFFLKPKPWTWVYHLVLICLGLTSPCCLPASVALLIFWIREDCRNYFGRK